MAKYLFTVTMHYADLIEADSYAEAYEKAESIDGPVNTNGWEFSDDSTDLFEVEE